MERPLPLSAPRNRLGITLRAVGLAIAAIVVGLVLMGQGIFLVRALGSEGADYAAPSSPHGTLAQRIDAIMSAALGSSDRGVRRYWITGIGADPAHRALRDVKVTWAINNDVSAGSIGNGAQQDVYTVLRDLYTSTLPLGLVRLTGTYPMQRSGRTKETTVMRLSMDRSTAQTIDEVGWDTMDPETVWPLVTRQWVAPELQPITGG